MRRPPRQDTSVRIAVDVDFDGIDFFSAELKAKQIAVDMASIVALPLTEFPGRAKVTRKVPNPHAMVPVMAVSSRVVDITEV